MSGNMSIKAFPFIVSFLTGNHLCGRTSAHSQINISWLEPVGPW